MKSITRAISSTAISSTAELGQDFHSAVVIDERTLMTQLHAAKNCTLPRRCCSEALVWSNLVLAVPCAIYLAAGFFMSGFALALSASTSFLYHFHFERHAIHLLLDRASAIFAFVVTLPSVWGHLSSLAKLFALFVVGLAFYFKHHQDLDYPKYHSLWHLSICVGQVFLSLHIFV